MFNLLEAPPRNEHHAGEILMDMPSGQFILQVGIPSGYFISDCKALAISKNIITTYGSHDPNSLVYKPTNTITDM